MGIYSKPKPKAPIDSPNWEQLLQLLTGMQGKEVGPIKELLENVEPSQNDNDTPDADDDETDLSAVRVRRRPKPRPKPGPNPGPKPVAKPRSLPGFYDYY